MELFTYASVNVIDLFYLSLKSLTGCKGLGQLGFNKCGLYRCGFNWWTCCMLFTAFRSSPGKIFKRSALNRTGSSRISSRQ